MMHKTSQPVPPPLRGVEIPSFTHYSIVTRLPEIAQRMLGENDFTPAIVARIRQLIDEIPNAPIRPLVMPGAPDSEQWLRYTQTYAGQNWLEVPWFFAEEYFYQRILEATGYYHPGPWKGRDPYAVQKRLGLETTSAEIHALADRLAQIYADLRRGIPASEAFAQLVLIDLWGNQNDLSLWPASETDSARTESADTPAVALREAQEHILDNHIESASTYFAALTANRSQIDMLLDNAGFELVCDLALADFFLSGCQAARVVLHIKIQPVFVSDAMEEDIRQTLAFLKEHANHNARSLASRLKSHIEAERLVLRADSFWTSPLAMWNAPRELLEALAGSVLLISKGDANYRRLLGDRHWPIDLPFAQVVDYLPTAVLALRTLKSEIATGITPDRIPKNDPNWMSNGQWGLVQFAPEPSPGAETRV